MLVKELQSDSHIESSKNVKGLKCARCCQPIATEEEGCNALGENFHNSCFHCNRCGSQLVNKKFVHSSKCPHFIRIQTLLYRYYLIKIIF